MSLQVQFLTLGLMAGCGMALGACFDTIGVVVREFRLGRVAQALMDVAYWAAATIFVFRVLMHANHGEVRLFIFIGLALGVLAYSLLFGGAVRWTAKMLIRLLKRIFLFAVKTVRILVIVPLLFIYRLLVRIVVAVAGICASVSIFLAKLVIQWGKLVWKRMRKRE